MRDLLQFLIEDIKELESTYNGYAPFNILLLDLDDNGYNDINTIKNGLNELLGEIRDYPIIDIDYVAEDETDKINSDRRVWQTYTNDTPCIKVIYGDKTNPNGNLTLEDMK